MDEFVALLKSDLGQGFILGLISSVVLLGLNILREWLSDRRKFANDERREEAERKESLRREFDEVLHEFLPKFERWSKDEEIAMRRFYEQPLDSDPSIDGKEHWKLTQEIELMLAKLFVKSFSERSHDVVRSARFRADQYEQESDYQYDRWRFGVDPEIEAQLDLDPLPATEKSLDLYVAAVGDVLDFHRFARIPELEGKLWSGEPDEATPAALGSGPIDNPRHRNKPSAAVSLDPGAATAAGLVEESEHVETAAAHADLDLGAGVGGEDGPRNG